jgi:hypothetical protein
MYGFGNRSMSTSSGANSTVSQLPGKDQAPTKVVLYKGFGMIPFRVLVRLKVFQLMGVASLAIPINTFLVQASQMHSQPINMWPTISMHLMTNI